MAPFVGRQPELAVLHARLADALAGRPQIVQIQGPAGIGKTALLEHFLRLIDTGPNPPAIVRASGEETEDLLTYGVIDQLARSAGIGWPAGPFAVSSGPGADPAATVGDPVTVGTRVLEFLDGLDRPAVILAIDDAHWADRPSLQALIFALRRLTADQVLALVVTRDDGIAPLPESLDRLVGGHRGTLMRLRGLDEQDLRDLAERLGLQDIGVAAARRLRYSTQGNPLYARALLEEFPPSEWGGPDRLLPSPRSFRRLVQDRYASCAEQTRRLIDAAAVLGPHAPLPVVTGLAGVAEPLLAIDEAVKSDLLEVREATSPWTLGFPHPLVRAAVYDELGPARRHDLHLAAAALVTEESSVLRHRVAAAAEPDEVLAADLTSFADQEARRQSWESAAAHLVSASRLSPDPQEAQRRVLRAVILTMLRGDAATAAGLAGEIATYGSGPFKHLVQGSLAMAADDPATAQRLLTAAWVDRGADDAELAATVALMTAVHWYGRLEAEQTVLWCRRSLALIEPSTAMRTVAMTYLIHGLGHSGQAAESLRVAEAAEQQPDDPDELWLNPRSARGLLRLVEDDLGGARADLESVAVTASRLGILNTSAYGFAYLARAEWLAGAWDDALLHAERAAAINLQADFGFMQSAVLGVALLVPACRGDWAAAMAYLTSMTQNETGYERSAVAVGIARARIAEARGRPADVVAALEPLRHFRQRDAVDEPGFWPWHDLYADALAAVGRSAEAAEFLIPHEELAVARGRRSAIARLARSRGRVEAMAGRPAAAEAAHLLALESIEGLHLPFEQARIELAAGGFLRRAGQRRRAADLLSAARERFVALGAQPYLERADTELAASGLSPVSRSGPDRVGLTAQELVVSRLAAQGRSNREIADELVVSIKTIEYHLRNAFAKLGVTSRRQLAARLAELTPGPD